MLLAPHYTHMLQGSRLSFFHSFVLPPSCKFLSFPFLPFPFLDPFFIVPVVFGEWTFLPEVSCSVLFVILSSYFWQELFEVFLPWGWQKDQKKKNLLEKDVGHSVVKKAKHKNFLLYYICLIKNRVSLFSQVVSH